jgi:hypothetical protein
LYLVAGNPFTRCISGDLLAARELKTSQRPFELPFFPVVSQMCGYETDVVFAFIFPLPGRERTHPPDSIPVHFSRLP